MCGYAIRQLRVGLVERECRIRLAAQPVDLVRWNCQRIQQPGPGKGEVAVGMIRRHAALVGPEKMDSLQRPGLRLCREFGVKKLGNAPAGKRNMESGACRNCFDEITRGGLRQRLC